MFKRDEDGLYFESQRTGRRYELFEAVSIDSNRTSDIITIFDYDLKLGAAYVGFLWGATYIDDKDTQEEIREIIYNYEIKFEQKIKDYLKVELILEFESDEECMNYFNIYDYQNFKSVEEMKIYQDEYGFNWGKKRYHIDFEEALDIYN